MVDFPQWFVVLIVVIAIAGVVLIILSRRRIPKGAKEKKAAATMDEVKKVTTGVPVPKVPAESEGGAPSGFDSLEEFPVNRKLGWEVTRIVKGLTKRITVTKGQVQVKAGRNGRPPKALFILVKIGGRNNLYFVDPRAIIKVVSVVGRRKKREVVSYKIVFDEFISEGLEQDGSVRWSDELEMILADSALDQYVTIAASEGGFRFTPTLQRALIIVGVLGFLIGLAVNGSAHIVPTTIIHWVPLK